MWLLIWGCSAELPTADDPNAPLKTRSSSPSLSISLVTTIMAL